MTNSYAGEAFSVAPGSVALGPILDEGPQPANNS
jgi:hypothetical protein